MFKEDSLHLVSDKKKIKKQQKHKTCIERPFRIPRCIGNELCSSLSVVSDEDERSRYTVIKLKLCSGKSRHSVVEGEHCWYMDLFCKKTYLSESFHKDISPQGKTLLWHLQKHYLRLLKDIFEDNYHSNVHSLFMFYRSIVNKVCLHFFLSTLLRNLNLLSKDCLFLEYESC